MADPVGFQGATTKLMAAPQDRDRVRDMPVFSNENTLTSCWRLTKEELEEVNRTGCVWLRVCSLSPPPVYVSGTALVLWNGEPSEPEPGGIT